MEYITKEPWKNRIKDAMELICPCQNYQLYCVENKSPNLYHLSMNSGRSIILKQEDVCYSETMLAEMGPSSWRLQQTATVQHCPPRFTDPLLWLPSQWSKTVYSRSCVDKLLTSLLTGSNYFPKTNNKTFFLYKRFWHWRDSILFILHPFDSNLNELCIYKDYLLCAFRMIIFSAKIL